MASTREIEMTNAVFQANEVVTIRGFQKECECSHCGRALKVGILLETFSGPFGAQCLAKAAAPYLYNGRHYRQNADSLKERAIIKGKGQACIDRHGMTDRNFKFELAKPLQSI
jgi:NAD-dependent SIR2 family protein deacetylase